jgi:anti-sigma regulatory factor (Ser/Thr protein kinase)
VGSAPGLECHESGTRACMSASSNQAGLWTLSESYPAIPEAVPLARRALIEFASAAGADDEILDSVRLAASEAISNVVCHAYGDEEGGAVHVTAAVASGELWLLISDDGHGLEVASRHPGLGMGLVLISSVADHFAVVRRSSGGTELRVCFTLEGGTPAGAQARGSERSARSPAAPRFSTTA